MFINPDRESEWPTQDGSMQYYGPMTGEFGGQIDAMLEDVCSWLEQDQGELAKLMRQIEDWRARVSATKDEQPARELALGS